MKIRRSINGVLGATTLALLVVASTPGHAATDAKASRLYEDALVRYQKQDLPGAIIQLKNALKIDKAMLPVHVLLGKALLASGDAIAAEVAFNEALRLGVNRAEVVVPLARTVVAQGRLQEVIDQPRFAAAGLPTPVQSQMWLLRAAALADLGNAGAAMKAIEEARALDPASADSWLAEVPVRLRARQFREAQAAAERALAIAPNLAEAHYLRGTVAHIQGAAAAALANYGKALQLQPAHTEALVSRAGMLLDQGRLADANRDITELLRTTPGDPRGSYLKALVAERQGDITTARAALNNVTALLDPVPIEFLRFRTQALMLGGLAHHGLNQREKAKPYLEAVLRSQPQSGVAKLLAQIHLADKNSDRAIEVLDPYLRAQPDDPQALMLLASAHMAQGRHSRAAQLMQNALRSQDNPEMRTMLGMSLVGGGKYGDAISSLESVFAKDSSQFQAGVALATLYLQSGQASKALKVAETLSKQRAAAPGVQNLLGLARARTGDKAGARTAFEAAAKLDPAFDEPQVNLARLEIDAKSYDAAQTRLNTLLAKNEKSVEVLSELAHLAERRGQADAAQRWLEKADDHSGPANLQPALALVDFQLRRGKPTEAGEAAKRLTAKAPEALPVLLALARVSLANGDAPSARTQLSRAASLADYKPALLVQIALMQMQAAHLPGAAHSLGKALSERPDYLPAQALMAEVELRQGELAKAEVRIRQIMAAHPKAAVGHGLAGDLATARGQRRAAIEAYRRAHQVEPSTASLLRLVSALGAVDGPAALALAESWLKANPGDVAIRRAVADGQARAGNLGAARSSYEALLKVQPDDSEALNNLANVMLLANDPGALKVAEAALQKNPVAPHIIGTAGWAAFKAGQPDRALQLLRDARLRDPANPETRYFLGAVLASTGRKTEAREELEAALRVGPFASAKEAEQLLRTLR
ncbi:MAG TPA: PEP-CTERM system TPR-repeat protein PrsT [Rubrivivax sp.]|nr:PEP-CTERM system TPR-repeat protein PrsT [Rubrivivax sp.]